jgi:hypothetical protein
MDQDRATKTATGRAAKVIEVAGIIFAEETGDTLDLSPAAKAALIATFTAAIQAAVVEERECRERSAQQKHASKSRTR